MPLPIPQESNKPRVIPKAYVSGFTFFERPDIQRGISELTGYDLQFMFLARPKEKARYIHELWRTGRMETLYDFFILTPTQPGNTFEIVYGNELPDDQVTEDDVIFNTAIMMKVGNVSKEEAQSFIHDLTCASANAHDHQEYGEEPIYPAAVNERVEGILQAVEELVPELPE